MIVLILSGGLGNQLFEYAAARAMALRAGTDVCLNTRMGFERDKDYKRTYCLNQFNIKYVENRVLSFDFPLGYVFRKISERLGRHIFAPWYRFIYDNKVDPSEIKQFPGRFRNVVLIGTWVQQVFFDDYLDVIRKDFEYLREIPQTTQEYFKEIENSNYPVIGMGVRVYQEIKDASIKNTLFFYTHADFYNNALDYYKKKYGRFKLLIFTQATTWVKENVDLDGIDYKFVQSSTGDEDAILDLLILSKCKDYIIANSSFYWWGVWFNTDEKKEVLIPRQWNNSSLDNWKKL